MVIVLVNVMEKDIASGKSCTPDHCPVALALLRVIKKGVRALVGSQEVSVVLDANADFMDIDLPKAARKFINSLDHQQSVKPFSFKLNVHNKAASLFRKSAILPQ